MVITIDGPAGSGKSTTARLVAQKLGFKYLDTGATYRVVAWAVLKNNIPPFNEKEVEELVPTLNIYFKDGKIFLEDEDVSQQIRTEEIGKIASLCSTYKGVRENMVTLQRKIAQNQSIVCEGRDMGTVVFPDAEIKIYMDANVETRAKRRQKELAEKGISESFESIIESIKSRDKQDSTRKHSPLKIADGAIIIDTTNLSIDEQVAKVVEITKKELA